MGDITVTLLGSGVALGVYIPALLVDYQLNNAGFATEVIILEDLFRTEKQLKILENKKAFHRDFRVALTGQKLAGDLRPNYDLKIVEAMFARWKREHRQYFIVFSGFWMPILKEYEQLHSTGGLQVDVVHMDADISASWNNFQDEAAKYHNVWLFNGADGRLDYQLAVGEQSPLPFAQRADRYVIHGGGWGMGTYQSKISELETAGMALDIVAYDLRETEQHRPNCRYFMINPQWSPWHQNEQQQHEFPPFGAVCSGQTPVFANKPAYHELYDLVVSAKAIISKPGGATLVDSLASATPLVMLEPFGGYEQQNAALWERLGLGISYPKWQESGYSEKLLADLHQNLLRIRATTPDYITDYRQRNRIAQAI